MRDFPVIPLKTLGVSIVDDEELDDATNNQIDGG
jgi:hypothetical protein